MEYTDLPPEVRNVCDVLIPGLRDILGDKLYGFYMYGALLFPESGPAGDIDGHVVLNAALTDDERSRIHTLYEHLAEAFPPFGGDLDVWYVLLEEARRSTPPQNQLKTDMYDKSWALHCAHVRAGRYLALCGPEPDDIFPEQTWEDIVKALDDELDYIGKALRYPAFCVLNLCRILYSFRNRDVVVSKRYSGKWLAGLYPQRAPMIEAALKDYEGITSRADREFLRSNLDDFREAIEELIRKAR